MNPLTAHGLGLLIWSVVMVTNRHWVAKAPSVEERRVRWTGWFSVSAITVASLVLASGPSLELLESLITRDRSQAVLAQLSTTLSLMVHLVLLVVLGSSCYPPFTEAERAERARLKAPSPTPSVVFGPELLVPVFGSAIILLILVRDASPGWVYRLVAGIFVVAVKLTLWNLFKAPKLMTELPTEIKAKLEPLGIEVAVVQNEAARVTRSGKQVVLTDGLVRAFCDAELEWLVARAGRHHWLDWAIYLPVLGCFLVVLSIGTPDFRWTFGGLIVVAYGLDVAHKRSQQKRDLAVGSPEIGAEVFRKLAVLGPSLLENELEAASFAQFWRRRLALMKSA